MAGGQGRGPANPTTRLNNYLTAELHNYLTDLASGDDERAEAAVEGLAALPPAQWNEALDALQAMLTSPDIDTRWWAARALAAIPDAQVPALLLKAFADEEAGVRQCAALGLRLHPTELAVPALIAALSDEDSLVTDLSADALGEIGASAVPALLKVMQNGSHKARLGATRALATIGDPRAIPALYAALDSDSALMEYWATTGLEKMGVGMVFFKP